MQTLLEISGAVVIFGILLILLWDLYAFIRGGYRVTVSRVIQRWVYSGNPVLWIMIGFVLGGLFIHFVGWAPGPSEEIGR